MSSEHDNDSRRNPIDILLVEDSPSDAMLTREAIRLGSIQNNMHHVEDGVEALAFLRREREYAAAPRPDFVLLDLNMPRMNGHEVLRQIRSDDDLHYLPVIVLTTSDDEHDVLKSYDLNANCYITKPVDMTQFSRAMQSLDDFWMKWVTLPPRPSPRS